jgi:hypothetical protein
MVQFKEKRKDNYVIRTRDNTGRIRCLVIIDAPNKTKHQLNKELHPGCTIEFPSEAIEGETEFYTGRDRRDYTDIGYKRADRIKLISIWTPLPKDYWKEYPKEYIKIRLYDFFGR